MRGSIRTGIQRSPVALCEAKKSTSLAARLLDLEWRGVMRKNDVPNLVHRVWAEYRDFPGLRLTVAQAQRLLGVGEDTCRKIVGALGTAGHVRIDGDWVEGSASATSTSSPEPPNDAGAGISAPRVLVIEDDPAQLQLLLIGLSAAGYMVFGAADAGHGTAMALLKPDIIVLDIGLPDSDGYSVAACVRAEAAIARIPIIFLSGRQTPEDCQRAEALRADAYLVKPCRAAELANVIAQVLSYRKTRR